MAVQGKMVDSQCKKSKGWQTPWLVYGQCSFFNKTRNISTDFVYALDMVAGVVNLCYYYFYLQQYSF